METRVVVIGGANIDVCAKSNQSIIPRDSNIGKIEFALGGVGRNIAENLALFGCDTSLLTAIADDSFGHVVMDNAREQDISLLLEPFTDDGIKTGVYTYIADVDGSMLVAVNDMQIVEKITPEVIENNINALLFTENVVIEANLPKETIEKICSYDGLKIAADAVSITKCKNLENVLSKIKLLKCNRAEAYALSGQDNIQDAVRVLAKKGTKRGIISLGADGAMCFHAKSDGKIYCHFLGNLEGQKIVDTSGCGDAFLAGFLMGRMREKRMRDSLYYGQAAASLNAEGISSVNRNMNFFMLKDMVAEFKKQEMREEIL